MPPQVEFPVYETIGGSVGHIAGLDHLVMTNDRPPAAPNPQNVILSYAVYRKLVALALDRAQPVYDILPEIPRIDYNPLENRRPRGIRLRDDSIDGQHTDIPSATADQV